MARCFTREEKGSPNVPVVYSITNVFTTPCFLKNYCRTDGEFDLNYFYYVPKYFKNYYLSRAFEGFWLNDFMHSLRNRILYCAPRLRNINEKYLDHHIEGINRSLEYKNASVFFDGSKWIRRVELMHENGVPFSLVHLIRDPRGFCCSYIKNDKLENDLKGLDKAIAAWNIHLKKKPAY